MQIEIAKAVGLKHGYHNQHMLIWYKPNKRECGGDRLLFQTEYIVIMNNASQKGTQFSMNPPDLTVYKYAMHIRSNVIVCNTLEVSVYVHITFCSIFLV